MKCLPPPSSCYKYLQARDHLLKCGRLPSKLIYLLFCCSNGFVTHRLKYKQGRLLIISGKVYITTKQKSNSRKYNHHGAFNHGCLCLRMFDFALSLFSHISWARLWTSVEPANYSYHVWHHTKNRWKLKPGSRSTCKLRKIGPSNTFLQCEF